MKPLLRQQALLVLVAGILMLSNLGSDALFNNAEATNAACAAEMLRLGAWFVPTFNEKLDTEQPILGYWLILASYCLLGISEFSSRFASSMLSIATTLLTYQLGRKLYSQQVGFLGGIILCTCLLFSAYGRAATSDAALVFFVTLAFTSYVWVVAQQRGGAFSGFGNSILEKTETAPQRLDDAAESAPTVHSGFRRLIPASWKLATPMFVAMGFAVLAIGPAGLLLPCASILMFLLVELRIEDLESQVLKSAEGPWWRRWLVVVGQVFRPRQIVEAGRGLHLLVGKGIVSGIALPWFLCVGVITNGAWLREYWDCIVDQNVGVEGWHRGFPFYPLYHLVVIHLACFPWSVFLPVAVYQLWQRLRDDAILWRNSDRLLTCWIVVWFAVYSVISTKRANYLLPIYPAVALILARYFHDWEREEVDVGVYSFNLCCKALGAVGAIMVVGLCVAAYLYFPNGQWVAAAGLVPIIGAFAAIKFLDQELRRRVIQTLVATALILAFLLIGVAPISIGPHQESPIFIAEARRTAKSNDIQVATFDYFEPSIVFYAGKPVSKLDTPRQVADFLISSPRAFVITKASKHNELRDELRGDVVELSRHRNFLGREELILLGRN